MARNKKNTTINETLNPKIHSEISTDTIAPSTSVVHETFATTVQQPTSHVTITESKKVTVKLSKGRFWTDGYWNIYANEKRLTPPRWTKMMKQAIEDGTLKIVDDNPKAELVGFKTHDWENKTLESGKIVSSLETTVMQPNTIIQLDKKLEDIAISTQETATYPIQAVEKTASKEVEMNITENKTYAKSNIEKRNI